MMAGMQGITCLPILGTRIASVTYDEAVAAILDEAEHKPQAHAYVCAVNVHVVSLARRDAKFREVINGALMNVPDGKPLIWAHKVLGGRRLTERVYGPTLMLKLCEGAAVRGLSVYLYGGAPGVPEKLAEVLTKRWPALKIAGTCAPPFRANGDKARKAGTDSQFPNSRELVSVPVFRPELQREIEAINASGARLLFVALGAPKQEQFMHDHAAEIAPLQIGVGAAFDFHSGRVPQAPAWMQDAGLEWFFRFCAEPRRLWRRYLFYNPYFVARLMLQRFGMDGPSRELARANGDRQPIPKQPGIDVSPHSR
jgi:N-acetylglucosaminyldiphosphoundecaprenol N-acetyl-beta-D-mannosaminyltransferase